MSSLRNKLPLCRKRTVSNCAIHGSANNNNTKVIKHNNMGVITHRMKYIHFGMSILLQLIIYVIYCMSHLTYLVVIPPRLKQALLDSILQHIIILFQVRHLSSRVCTFNQRNKINNYSVRLVEVVLKYFSSK